MRVLHYSVRLTMLARYCGELLLALAVLSVVPLVAALFFHEMTAATRYAIVILVTGALGYTASRLRPAGAMQKNEAMVITAFIFLISPLTMVWPLMASGIGFVDALFEAVSAVTTTGLSTLPVEQAFSQTHIFSRAWAQWIGGLGIVVLGMAILISPGQTAKHLDIEEHFDDDIIGGTRAIARNTLLVYTLFTAAGILVLTLLGVHWYDAVLYCFAAISTGGFSPNAASLAALPGPWAQYAVMAICMIGALSLILFYRIYHRGPGIIFSDLQTRAFFAFAAIVVALLALLLWYERDLAWTQALHHGVISGLSALSTAGFSDQPIGEIGNGGKLVLLAAMGIGGCAGSTAGGLKVIRLLILFRLLYLLIQRAGAPSQAVSFVRLRGRKLSDQEMHNSATFFVLFIVVILFSWLPFLVLGYPPLDSLFEVVSALGTVGLSSGVTHGDLQPLLKAVLCFDMLLGRLEILAWLIVFSPGTWISPSKEE